MEFRRHGYSPSLCADTHMLLRRRGDQASVGGGKVVRLYLACVCTPGRCCVTRSILPVGSRLIRSSSGPTDGIKATAWKWCNHHNNMWFIWLSMLAAALVILLISLKGITSAGLQRVIDFSTVHLKKNTWGQTSVTSYSSKKIIRWDVRRLTSLTLPATKTFFHKLYVRSNYL